MQVIPFAPTKNRILGVLIRQTKKTSAFWLAVRACALKKEAIRPEVWVGTRSFASAKRAQPRGLISRWLHPKIFAGN